MSKLIKSGVVLSITSNGDFKGQNGTIYKFNIEFDNGDKGEFTTNKNPQTKFVVNETVKYTVEETEIQTSKGSWKKIKIDKLKEEGGRQYYTEDPTEQQRIIRSVSSESALKLKILTKSEMKHNEIAEKIREHVNILGETDKGKLISAQTAVKHAVLSIELNPDPLERAKYSVFEKFLTVVNYFFNYIYNG